MGEEAFVSDGACAELPGQLNGKIEARVQELADIPNTRFDPGGPEGSKDERRPLIR